MARIFMRKALLEKIEESLEDFEERQALRNQIHAKKAAQMKIRFLRYQERQKSLENGPKEMPKPEGWPFRFSLRNPAARPGAPNPLIFKQ